MVKHKLYEKTYIPELMLWRTCHQYSTSDTSLKSVRPRDLLSFLFDVRCWHWEVKPLCQNFIKINSNHHNLLSLSNFILVQFDKLCYFSLFSYYFNSYLNIQIFFNQNMFFFKEVQTVRKRRGAIANLDLVYNSRNASIRTRRHKGNFNPQVRGPGLEYGY